MKKNLTRDEIKDNLINRWMKLGRCFDEAEWLAEEELETTYDPLPDDAEIEKAEAYAAQYKWVNADEVVKVKVKESQ